MNCLVPSSTGRNCAKFATVTELSSIVFKRAPKRSKFSHRATVKLHILEIGRKFKTLFSITVFNFHYGLFYKEMCFGGYVVSMSSFIIKDNFSLLSAV